MSQTIAMDVLRHSCAACGGACQGVNIRLLEDEVEPIRALGAELGIDDPVQDGPILRIAHGRCVFQADDGRCRVHAAKGYAAKPVLCRQYPVIATRVDNEIRVGIDPGCYHASASWRDGPLVADSDLIAGRGPLKPLEARRELLVMDLLDAEGVTVARAIQSITGMPGVGPDTLPLGFDQRLILRIQDIGMAEIVHQDAAGPSLGHWLGPVAEAAATWDPLHPPAWPVLTPEQEAWALEVTRRMVYLRLGATALPSVLGVTLLTLAGAVVIGWSGADDLPTFGGRLAAWTRAIRATAFWRAILPHDNTLLWLARGDNP